ncbi:MAG: hypothetical protein OXC48_06500 [Endozoicomonadaceae bacterium]|nr:hypothetical protein [Endozoicomonadaceae bacterium]
MLKPTDKPVFRTDARYQVVAINFDVKITGKNSAVKLHAAFDVAGDGGGVN